MITWPGARAAMYALTPSAEISDEQVDQLAAATETLAQLVTLLQRQPIR